ncbi:hypothetical protein AgCh_019520 [Apium graveolens]
MAEHDVDGVEKLLEASDSHDIHSLLTSPLRDYLVRNSGDQVKTDALKGKTVGLYFAASWRGPFLMIMSILALEHRPGSARVSKELCLAILL